MNIKQKKYFQVTVLEFSVDKYEKVDEVSSATQKLINETGTSFFVIKAQVHAGGRGKEGIKLAKNIELNYMQVIY